MYKADALEEVEMAASTVVKAKADTLDVDVVGQRSVAAAVPAAGTADQSFLVLDQSVGNKFHFECQKKLGSGPTGSEAELEIANSVAEGMEEHQVEEE